MNKIRMCPLTYSEELDPFLGGGHVNPGQHAGKAVLLDERVGDLVVHLRDADVVVVCVQVCAGTGLLRQGLPFGVVLL